MTDDEDFFISDICPPAPGWEPAADLHPRDLACLIHYFFHLMDTDNITTAGIAFRHKGSHEVAIESVNTILNMLKQWSGD